MSAVAWQMLPLGELADVSAGQGAPQNHDDFSDDGVPFIRAGSLDALLSGGSEDDCERVPESTGRAYGLRLFPADTILFAKSGMSAKKGRVYKLRQPAYVTNHLAAIVPTGQSDPGYLFRWLTANPPTHLIPNESYPSIRLSDVGCVKVPTPSSDSEQRRIAAILDKADAIRARRRAALADADALARATFLYLFGDPVINPMKWPVRQLSDLCRIRRGASPRPIADFLGGSVPWFRIGDATGENSSIYLSETADHVTEEGAAKSVRLEPGAMIFANCGVSLGFARIVTIGGCIHDGWLAFDQFDESLDQRFLLALINVITKHLRAIAPDGTQPNLNTRIMGGLGIVLPPRELQRRFLSTLERIEPLHAASACALADADALYASLATRAFRGEL